jgi:hypothetical protein
MKPPVASSGISRWSFWRSCSRSSSPSIFCEMPICETDLGGKPRALGADRVLDHLHHQALSFVQDLLDWPLRVAVMALFPDIGHVQESRAFQTHIDKGRLHPGQHAHHAPHVDIADQPAALRAFDVQFLHRAQKQHGDTRFLRGHVDENFFAHGKSLFHF